MKSDYYPSTELFAISVLWVLFFPALVGIIRLLGGDIGDFVLIILMAISGMGVILRFIRWNFSLAIRNDSIVKSIGRSGRSQKRYLFRLIKNPVMFDKIRSALILDRSLRFIYGDAELITIDLSFFTAEDRQEMIDRLSAAMPDFRVINDGESQAC